MNNIQIPQFTTNSEMPTNNIIFNNKGQYNWVYELSLLKNPVVLFLLMKIFFWIVIGMWGFFCLLMWGDVMESWESFWGFTRVLLGVLVLIEILSLLGYLLYAAIMGGKYCVVFTMDEKGIKHEQMPKQYKRAQIISNLTVLAGLASGRPSVVGTGLLSRRAAMYTKFSTVKTVRLIKKRNTIKLSGNQIYATDSDFDFVANYIIQHVNKKCQIIVI